MNENNYQHLFGPVPSRRLGRSLGIDLVPFKTCSFDCIFCQLGRTTDRTTVRKEYVPVEPIITELDRWLAAGNTADYITLAGSGEPTLNSEFGKIIEFARQATTIPVALLTNGSLLTDPDVRAQAAAANLVKISLSAWDQTSLIHVNRPHESIQFRPLIEAQRQFRQEFDGELWLEVFLVWGTNATPEEVSRIARLTETLEPDKIQLNTAVRPPCEEFAYAVPEDRMRDLAHLFAPPAELIAEYSGNLAGSIDANERDIASMLARRPCTLAQIGQAFGLHQNEVAKYLGKLTRTGRARQYRKDDKTFFVGSQEKGVPGAGQTE